MVGSQDEDCNRTGKYHGSLGIFMVVVIWYYSDNVCSSCKGRGWCVGTDKTRHREGRMCMCVRQRILEIHRDRDTIRERRGKKGECFIRRLSMKVHIF